MTRRIPNLETAINYCRINDISFSYGFCNRTAHIKFYVEDSPQFILISSKNDNRDKVVKDIRKRVEQ